MGTPVTFHLQDQLRAVSVTDGGEDHVEHARGGCEALPEAAQERCSHRGAEIIASQRGTDPVGVDVGGNKMVGSEADHRIYRPREAGQDLDRTVSRGEPTGGRVGEHSGKAMFSPRSGSSDAAHNTSLPESTRPGADTAEAKAPPSGSSCAGEGRSAGWGARG